MRRIAKSLASKSQELFGGTEGIRSEDVPAAETTAMNNPG